MSNQNVTTEEDSRNPPIMVDISLKYKYNQIATTQNKTPEEKEKVYFSRMVDLFMLSLIHGYKEGLRKPLDSKKEELFRWSTFKEGDVVIIKAICLLEKNINGGSNPEVIISKSEMIKIIQEYANGGFSKIISILEGSPDYEKNFTGLLAQELEVD